MSTRSNIRLLQLMVGEQHGGAERFFVKLAIALKAAGIEQKLVIKKDAARLQELTSHGCDAVGLPFASGIGDLAARWQLRQITRRFRPTVAMAWMNRAARRMPAGPFVKIARFGGYYPLRYYRRFDWIICNTPDLAQHVVDNGWAPDRVRVISNFGELPPPQAGVKRSDLCTPADAFVMLTAGRFVREKGFDIVIRALARIPDAVLWIAGAGPEEDALRRLATSLDLDDRVRFLGWRGDQAALFSACDVCVVPSRHEPLSNVILEAWSRSVAVVATASEGPQWLLADEQGGLLVPIDDVEALTAAINRIRLEPALKEQLRKEGHAKWQASFSRDATVEAFVKLFTDVTACR